MEYHLNYFIKYKLIEDQLCMAIWNLGLNCKKIETSFRLSTSKNSVFSVFRLAPYSAFSSLNSFKTTKCQIQSQRERWILIAILELIRTKACAVRGWHFSIFSSEFRPLLFICSEHNFPLLLLACLLQSFYCCL